MTISKYDTKYDEDIIELIKDFYDESLTDYDTRLDMEALKKTISIYKDNAFLMIVENHCVGIIAGLQVNSPINSDKVYQEIVWFVKKNHRREGVIMLKEVERILQEAGFTAIIMACLYNSKTEKLFNLYKRMGYRPIETHFRRDLCRLI